MITEFLSFLRTPPLQSNRIIAILSVIASYCKQLASQVQPSSYFTLLLLLQMVYVHFTKMRMVYLNWGNVDILSEGWDGCVWRYSSQCALLKVWPSPLSIVNAENMALLVLRRVQLCSVGLQTPVNSLRNSAGLSLIANNGSKGEFHCGRSVVHTDCVAAMVCYAKCSYCGGCHCTVWPLIAP